MLRTKPLGWLLREATGVKAMILKISRVVCEALVPTLALGVGSGRDVRVLEKLQKVK